jgi:hypothetical protein
MDFEPIPTTLKPGSDLESGSNCPYWVDIHAAWVERIRLRKEIAAWYQEQGGLCATTPVGECDRYFLHNEQEQVLFLLRWR